MLWSPKGSASKQLLFNFFGVCQHDIHGEQQEPQPHLEQSASEAACYFRLAVLVILHSLKSPLFLLGAQLAGRTPCIGAGTRSMTSASSVWTRHSERARARARARDALPAR